MSLEVDMEGAEGLRDLIRVIKDNLVNQEVLDAMAAEAGTRVLERTGAGRDVHGDLFKPYSKAYQKIRQKHGLSTSRVDLKRTGEMLGAMQAVSSPDRGLSTVSFNDSKNARKAEFHNEKRHGREFFGLDDIGKEAIAGILEAHIDEVIADAY